MSSGMVFIMATFDDGTSAELFLTQYQYDGILEQLDRDGVIV